MIGNFDMRMIGNLTNIYRSFNINKGSIKVVNENSQYRIKYPEDIQDKIVITEDLNGINVILKEDLPGKTITINTYGMEECKVKLGAGVMSTVGVCPKSQYIVDSGVLNVDLDKGSTGMVTGKIGIGVLTNKSNLDTTSLGGGGNNNMFNWQTYMTPQQVELSGDLVGSGYSAQFDVTTGTLNFSNTDFN